MAESIFAQMKKVRMNLKDIAPQLYHIKTKDRGIVPFNPSLAQLRFWEDEDIGSDIVLKARQLGISTMTVIEFLAYAMTIPGFTGVIISEDRDKTKRLLRIAHLALDMIPKEYKVPNDHSREDYIIFKAPPEGTGASLYIGTAGSLHFGRGDTIHAAHCSELGLWENAEELLNGLEESVPLRDGAILRIESTAYGQGNHFHRLCEAAMHNRGGRYKFWFFPWWFALDDEYKLPLKEDETIHYTDEEKELVEYVNLTYQFQLTPEHIKWRRTKIQAKGRENFLQEYPEDSESCFLATGNAVFYGIMNMLSSSAKQLRPLQPLTVEDKRGVRVEKYKLSKSGESFLLAVDTSEGTQESSDYDAITVWKVSANGSIEQAVSAAGRVDSSSLTHAIVELSEEYNNALVVVERANKGFSILDKLLEVRDRYDFEIYHHMEFDQETRRHKPIPGWRPTQASKAAAIGRFEEMFKTGECIVWDDEIIDQAMSYQYDKNTGKAGAPEGMYDDKLTTTMMACYTSEEVPLSEHFDVVDVY